MTEEEDDDDDECCVSIVIVKVEGEIMTMPAGWILPSRLGVGEVEDRRMFLRQAFQDRRWGWRTGDEG